MEWSRSVALTALLLACNEGDGGGEDPVESGTDSAAAEESSGSGGELPSPYSGGTGDPTDGEQPTMGKDEAVASAFAGMQTILALQPMGVVDEFEALFEPEEGCPEEFMDADEGDGNRVLYFYTESCTTSSGLTISGGGQLQRWTGVVEGERTSQGALLSADGGTIRLERGNRWLQFSGYLEVERGDYEGGEQDGYFGFVGEASADGQTRGSSPLLEPEIRASAQLFGYTGGGFKAIGGSGSLTGSALGNAVAMAFDNVGLADAECAAEPGGSLAVRDDAGFWHDVVFDAVNTDTEEWEWIPDNCDGCGSYLAGGVADGDACVAQADVAALLDWQELPW